MARPHGAAFRQLTQRDEGNDVETQDVISALTLLVAVRVLIPDACRLLRRVLGEGVRVGAAALAEQHRTPPDVSTVQWAPTRQHEEDRA